MLVCSAGVLTSGLALLRGSWWRCADLDFPCLSLLHGWVPAPSFPRRSPLFFRPSVAITFARPVAVRRGARRPHQPAFTTMCSSNISSTRTLSPRTAATRTRPGLSSRGGGLWGSLPSKRWRWVCGCGLLGRSDMGGGPLGPFFSPLFFLFFFFLSVVVWCTCSLLQRPRPLCGARHHGLRGVCRDVLPPSASAFPLVLHPGPVLAPGLYGGCFTRADQGQ